MRIGTALLLLILSAATAPALPGCRCVEEPATTPRRVTVDFLEPLGLEASALAPQLVLADAAHNRVFAACANSSALAVIDCATGQVTGVPVGSRMPRRLRDGAMVVSPGTGELLVCGRESLVVVDPGAGTARTIPLPADFETAAVHAESGRAFLAGRTSGSLAVVETASGRVRAVPFGEAAGPLPFMAASAPPPIRFPFVDGERGRVYVVDGVTSALHTFDLASGELIASRWLPVDVHPRWHVAGFSAEAGRIFAAVESEKREAVLAIAIDTTGDADLVAAIPEGHTEPAGVACDPERQELYIPYDNHKLIHVVSFGGDEPQIASIEMPSMGMDATAFDPATRTLYVAGWMQAALYVVDLEARKRTFTVPFFPVFPHMNSMDFNAADGRLYVPSGSTAVNGAFGAALTVFDPRTLGFSEIRTGWGPVSLAQKPGSDAFFVFGAEREFAEVRPDGSVTMHSLPHPYARQALLSPDGKTVRVAYGPHSSMWPSFYIGGTRNGIAVLDADGSVVEDLMTPRLAQGMVFDREGRFWFLQNTWGPMEPPLICHPGNGEGWFDLPLPPKVDNECVLRLLACDEETGLLYAVRTGDVNTENGRVHVVDPETRTVRAAVETGRTPSALCLLPGEGRAFVSNFDDGTVTIISEAGACVETVPAGRGPLALAQHRETGNVYVVNHLDASLTVLGLDSARTVQLPAGALPNNILVEPLTGHVFVTAHGESEARVYRCNPKTAEVETIHTCTHPYGETAFDQADAAFQLRGQWGDGLFRITEMALDDEGRLWVTDYLGGKLWILKVF